MTPAEQTGDMWRRRKARMFRFSRTGDGDGRASPGGGLPFPTHSEPLFDNPFTVCDLGVFDDYTLAERLSHRGAGIDAADLGRCAAAMPPDLRRRVRCALSGQHRRAFDAWQRVPTSSDECTAAAQRVLEALFWDLTYWHTPDLYEALTEGERLHPGIFARLAPMVEDAAVLDAGAGSGRASVECVRAGARQVIALEPSSGLLRLLRDKTNQRRTAGRIVPVRGRFDAVPLADRSVDLAIACSSFTAEPGQGGDPGLAELRRVTRPGGWVVVIWPRVEDYAWLAARGFRYEPLPLEHEMTVRFRSLDAAFRCARRFYGRRPAVLTYLLRHRRPAVPFSVLGFNPPHDFCWLPVPKTV